MASNTIFFYFIPILALILLAINIFLASHNPYQEKDSVFECGFHSFLGQNRSEFNVSFYLFGVLFLGFDVELLIVLPYALSGYNNESFGLTIVVIFFLLLTLAFVYELGKNALSIQSKQKIDMIEKVSNGSKTSK